MNNLYLHIARILHAARRQVVKAVNTAMVQSYWEIGRIIVEEEQKGRHRAEYGANLIKYLSDKLTEEFGKGFTETNLKYFRQFYQTFQTRHALRDELSWTHYRSLLRVENPAARAFYLQEALDNGWSTRSLDRQINTLYYERLLASGDRGPVISEMQSKTDAFQPADFLKDPYVLEFLQLQENSALQESELEQALMNKLQQFLLELGKGGKILRPERECTTLCVKIHALSPF